MAPALGDATDPRRGCGWAAVAAAALAVLAPGAAAVRGWCRWRRGTRVRIDWSTSDVDAATGPVRIFDIALDSPEIRVRFVHRELTETMVRLAEALRTQDEAYHLVYRVPTEPESVALPIGPSIQALGDRFQIALGQHDLEGRTVVWLALPPGIHIAEVVDPFAYDPAADGEPHRLMRSVPAAWAVAIARGRGPASEITRLLMLVPEDRSTSVESLLDSLRTQLLRA